MKNKRIISILLILIMLSIVCTGCSFTDKKDEEKNEIESVDKKEEEKEPYIELLDNYYDGIVRKNLKKYLSVYPKFMKMEKEIDEDDFEDMLEILEDEFGRKIKISYEVKKEKEIKKEKLELIEKYIKIMYNEEVKVFAGYEIKVAVTIEGQNDMDISTSDMYIYKIDGEWYFLVSPRMAEEYVTDYEDR